MMLVGGLIAKTVMGVTREIQIQQTCICAKTCSEPSMIISHSGDWPWCSEWVRIVFTRLPFWQKNHRLLWVGLGGAQKLDGILQIRWWPHTDRRCGNRHGVIMELLMNKYSLSGSKHNYRLVSHSSTHISNSYHHLTLLSHICHDSHCHRHPAAWSF